MTRGSGETDGWMDGWMDGASFGGGAPRWVCEVTAATLSRQPGRGTCRSPKDVPRRKVERRQAPRHYGKRESKEVTYYLVQVLLVAGRCCRRGRRRICCGGGGGSRAGCRGWLRGETSASLASAAAGWRVRHGDEELGQINLCTGNGQTDGRRRRVARIRAGLLKLDRALGRTGIATAATLQHCG